MAPSPEALLDDLRRLHDVHDQLPSGPLVEREGAYDIEDYRAAFGSLPEALNAAGFDLPEWSATRISNAEALADLHRLLAELQRRPTSRDINEHGRFSEMFYQQRFGSINDALERAGFRTDCPPVPTSLLIEDLRQLGADLGRPPTREEFDEVSQLSRHALEKRIGWRTALRRAGLKQTA